MEAQALKRRFTVDEFHRRGRLICTDRRQRRATRSLGASLLAITSRRVRFQLSTSRSPRYSAEPALAPLTPRYSSTVTTTGLTALARPGTTLS